MAEFLKMKPEDLVTRYYGETYTENGQRFVRYNRDLTTPCPFLEKGKSCQIYLVCPDGCKAYPIETNPGRGEVDCPAMRIVDAMDHSGEGEDEPLNAICLLFENPEEKGILHPPFAYICIGSWSSPKILGYERIALSAECTSYDEVK